MKYYLTQAGLAFLGEDYVKDAEDAARAKVKKRVAKARLRGEKISSSQEGTRAGKARWWAGKEAIRRS